MEDWYSISQEKIISNGGATLLRYTKMSPSELVMNIFDEYQWLPWKFLVTPKEIWTDKKVQRNFLSSLGKSLGIIEKDQWYRVTYKEIRDFGGSGLLSIYGNSPSKTIMSVFDDYKWSPWKFKNVNRGLWEEVMKSKFFCVFLCFFSR